MNIVLDVMKKLVEVGAVPRGLLGLTSQNISTDIAEAFGLGSTDGALVTEVLKDSPAERAGIVHGDIIVQIGDSKILFPRFAIKSVTNVSGIRGDCSHL